MRPGRGRVRAVKRLLLALLLALPLSAHAAITFIDGTSANNSSATSVTPSEPSGTAQNDIVIAHCAINSTGGTWTDPADFTEIDQEDTAPAFAWTTYVGYKIRGATAGSGYTFSASSSAAQIVCTLLTYRGIDTSTPFDVTFSAGSHYSEHNNDVTAAAPPITTVTNGAEVVLLQHWNGGVAGFALGAPSGYTSREEVLQASRVNFAVSKNVATAGTETPGVYTTTGSATTQDSSNYTLALRPAGAAADPPDFSAAPALDDCDSDSCTFDFTPDASATLYYAAYVPAASAPSDCPAVQAASGAVESGSEAVTGADSVDIPSGLIEQSYYFCLSNGDGDSDVESVLGQDRDPRSGYAFVTLASIDPTSFCDRDAYFTPDMAAGDRIEYKTTTTPSGYTVDFFDTACNYSIAAGGDTTQQHFETLYQDLSSTTDGQFTAPAAGIPGSDDTVYVNNHTPAYNNDCDTVEMVLDEAGESDRTICWTDEDGDLITITFQDSLPTGLTNSNGLVEGTPTACGISAVTERGADIAGDYAEGETTFNIGPRLPDLSGMTAAEAASTIDALCD